MSESTHTGGAALRAAWSRWALFAAISVGGLAAVVPLAERTGLSGEAWFVVPLLWLALVVPAVAALHGHCFRSEWSEQRMLPEAYLRSLTSIWAVLTLGVGLSLVACLLAGSVSPSVWPGAVMVMLLVLARPSAAAIDA